MESTPMYKFVPFEEAKEWMKQWRAQKVKPDVNGFTIPIADIKELYQLPDVTTIRIYFGINENENYPMPKMKLLVVGVDEHGNDILPDSRNYQGYPIITPPSPSTPATTPTVENGILDNTRPSPPFSGASLLVQTLDGANWPQL